MNLKNIIIGSTASLLLSSCFSLDQYPHDELSNEDAFKSVLEAKYWVNGRYEQLREVASGVYNYVPEFQTDLLDVRFLNDINLEIYSWDNFTTSNVYSKNFWNKYYHNLSHINNAIAGFETIVPKNDSEIQELNEYKGEMYLFRALYYTKLASLYCKAYDESTASTDLGLPLVLSLTTSNFPARSSVKETYEQILSDISKAEELLVTKAGKAGSETFTHDAVLLLKARVLLYKGEWKLAYDVASSLVDSGTYPLATTPGELEQIWYHDNGSEMITQLFMSTSDPRSIDNSSKEDVYIGRSRWAEEPNVLPNNWLLNLYEDNDIRKSVYYKNRTVYLSEPPYTAKNLFLVYKFSGNPALQRGSYPQYEHKAKIFRIAEAYLIAAEAAYHNGDQANAIKYLDLLRESRGASEVTQTGSALFDVIKNERVRELSFEGFRLMDLKRWKDPVVRDGKEPQDMEYVKTTPPEQFHKLRRQAGDYRMVWPINADDVILLNGVLKQNPGW